MAHGVKEDGGGVGRDDRIDAWGTLETCPGPTFVALGGGGDGAKHQERQEKKLSCEGFAKFFHILLCFNLLSVVMFLGEVLLEPDSLLQQQGDRQEVPLA